MTDDEARPLIRSTPPQVAPEVDDPRLSTLEGAVACPGSLASAG